MSERAGVSRENLTAAAAMVEEVGGLCRRFDLGTAQRDQLLAIVALLAEAKSAPTAVRAPLDAVRVHLADSLVALELEEIRTARTLADLGAGAGFPGLPLAIALPESELRLIESQRRKCAFIEALCRSVGIANARTVCARAEEWSEGIGVNDVVLARALAPAPVVLEYAAPLLRLEGSLVDWRGRRRAEEERVAVAAAAELGLRLVEIRRVEPYPGAREHHLHRYRKVAPTPSRYPRRAGAARKRPLGC